MKTILIVGASGRLGSAIAAELAPRHKIITAGRTSGDLRFDIKDANSIITALNNCEKLDAIISATGHVNFAPLSDFKAAPYGDSLHTKGLSDKLLGQVNLALAARDVLNDNGSITLTTGILADRFIVGGASATLVNRAVEGFAQAAATEMPRGIRINVVSPNLLVESVDVYGPYFPGFVPVKAADAAKSYAISVEGSDTGQIYKVF